jgi:polysaccharide biosynthesis/export protein
MIEQKAHEVFARESLAPQPHRIGPDGLRNAARRQAAGFRGFRPFLDREAGLISYTLRVIGVLFALILVACTSPPVAPPVDAGNPAGAEYQIGAGDTLNVFVWQQPRLSVTASVRPDGRISTPLVQDVDAVGKTPSQLAKDLEQRLKKYVKDPIVTVIPTKFVGAFDQQVRVIGEAAQPRAIPYRANMTVLDAMIEVGGLTKYAAGNKAVIVRRIKGEEQSYPVMLDSLVKDGDVRYNFKLQPGDIIIIPQSSF